MHDTKTKIAGWFDAAVLKGVAWSVGVLMPILMALTGWAANKYIDMEVKLAKAVMAEDLTKFEIQIRDDMRNAVRDGISAIEARQIADELRLAALEARH